MARLIPPPVPFPDQHWRLPRVNHKQRVHGRTHHGPRNGLHDPLVYTITKHVISTSHEASGHIIHKASRVQTLQDVGVPAAAALEVKAKPEIDLRLRLPSGPP